MVIWIKFSLPISFSSLIPKCQLSFLQSPAWLHPIYLDSQTWNSSLLCNIVLYRIRLSFHLQTHPQLSTLSSLAQTLHSFLSYFSLSWATSNGPPLFFSSILNTFHLWGLTSQYHNFLSFHTALVVLKTRILGWVAFSPHPHGSRFVRALHCDPAVLHGSTWHGSTWHGSTWHGW